MPLGGLGRIGGNMMLYETAGDLFAVDCGVNFPRSTEPGVRWIVPDISYLMQRLHKFRGYVITHGHEDHLGALPFVLPDAPAPVWGTPFTLAVLRPKLGEHGLEADLREIRDGEPWSMGDVTLHPIPVPPGSSACRVSRRLRSSASTASP